MNNMWEPPERSGGIDFDQSDVHAQDVVGRDKIEFNLPPVARKGCYAQLSENVKIVIILGSLLLLIYAFFQSYLPSVVRQTPTPTVVETATATPTATREPVTTPTATGDNQLSVDPTATLARSPLRRTATVVNPEEGTPVVMATATVGSVVIVSPTRRLRRPTPTATQDAVHASTPVVRPPTPTQPPTPTPTPTRLLATPVPSPRPWPTVTPQPPTPTSSPCTSAAVRLGPVAWLVTEGDRFTVNVVISCAVSLAGYQIELRFDPSVVIVRSVGNAGFLGSAGGSVFVAGPDVNNRAGEATIGAVVLRPGPFPNGSGTLAAYSLEAVERGSTDLDLSVSLSDVSGQAIPVSVSGGAVVVRPPAAATPSAP